MNKKYFSPQTHKAKNKYKVYFRRTAVQDAIDLITTYGGGTLNYEQSVQMLKGGYFKKGQSVPFVIIPEW